MGGLWDYWQGKRQTPGSCSPFDRPLPRRNLPRERTSGHIRGVLPGRQLSTVPPCKVGVRMPCPPGAYRTINAWEKGGTGEQGRERSGIHHHVMIVNCQIDGSCGGWRPTIIVAFNSSPSVASTGKDGAINKRAGPHRIKPPSRGASAVNTDCCVEDFGPVWIVESERFAILLLTLSLYRFNHDFQLGMGEELSTPCTMYIRNCSVYSKFRWKACRTQNTLGWNSVRGHTGRQEGTSLVEMSLEIDWIPQGPAVVPSLLAFRLDDP
ncbi:hypothetical protein R1flu_022912 [Riccia fluitans]|uniref:Uncharacterized protein n=1 Tax=Riccia fluitans TaxID=41844 RepID=A0ABD1XQK6_9MARC